MTAVYKGEWDVTPVSSCCCITGNQAHLNKKILTGFNPNLHPLLSDIELLIYWINISSDIQSSQKQAKISRSSLLFVFLSRCIVRALKDPNAFLFDHLLTLKPVKFLEGELIHDVSSLSFGVNSVLSAVLHNKAEVPLCMNSCSRDPTGIN